MLDNFTAALQITAIGMSLVFAAILLMWGLMAGLVRVAVDPPEPDPPPLAEIESAPPVAEPAPDVQRTLKQRAAAVAVAIALTRVPTAPPRPAEPPLPPTAIVSAWQAVTRARQLTQRGPRR